VEYVRTPEWRDVVKPWASLSGVPVP
jgi:hypothetical protein